MQKEMSVIKNLTDFIGGQSETVLPKMINAYNKKKQGAQYLKSILQKPLSEFITIQENLELNPLLVRTHLPSFLPSFHRTTKDKRRSVSHISFSINANTNNRCIKQ